jgi:hypothetical protein
LLPCDKNVAGINAATDIDVSSEVAVTSWRKWLQSLLPREEDIARINATARVDVAQEHIHPYRANIATTGDGIGYSIESDVHMRGIGNPGEIDNVLVRVSPDAATNLVLRQGLRPAAGVGRGCDAGGARTSQRLEESKHQSVISRGITA